MPYVTKSSLNPEVLYSSQIESQISANWSDIERYIATNLYMSTFQQIYSYSKKILLKLT